MKYRIVFGISGASGMPLARAVLDFFATIPNLVLHGIISEHAKHVLRAEGGELSSLPFHTLSSADDCTIGPCSGSWQHMGMIVCPCSMSTLAHVANGCGINSLHRACDVTLKERRPLILVVRETPLSLIHIRSMQLATEAGAVIMPFMPSFYQKDCSLDGILRHFAGRLLDQLHIPHTLPSRWRDNQ